MTGFCESTLDHFLGTGLNIEMVMTGLPMFKANLLGFFLVEGEHLPGVIENHTRVPVVPGRMAMIFFKIPSPYFWNGD